MMAELDLGGEIEGVRRVAEEALLAAGVARDRFGEANKYLRKAHGGEIGPRGRLLTSQKAVRAARTATTKAQWQIRRALQQLGDYRREAAPGRRGSGPRPTGGAGRAGPEEIELRRDPGFDRAAEHADDVVQRFDELASLRQQYFRLSKDLEYSRGGHDAVFWAAEQPEAEVHDHALLVMLLMLVLTHRFRKKG